MTLARHSASPAVSGFDGALSPGVQAGSPRQSVERGASNNDPWCSGSTPKWDHPAGQYQSGCGGEGSIPSGSPVNGCGGVDRDTHARMVAGKVALCRGAEKAEVATWPRYSVNPASRCNSGPQSSICPELTAYITTLLAVVGAVVWAHVFAMGNTLVDQLINFHPKTVICDGLGNKPEFLCAVSHKEGG